MITTAVVLVGGSATRLMPYTSDRPKCLVEVGGKPILYWVFKWLKSQGIQNVVLGVAYKKEMIINYIENIENCQGLLVAISEHTVEGETGEGFRLAIERFIKNTHFGKEPFLAMNGDELVNINLKNMEIMHSYSNNIATIAISPMRSNFGIVEIYMGNIVSFREKPILTDKLVNCGVYIFTKKILEYLPKEGNIETLTFPILASAGLLGYYELSIGMERWATVNTIKDISNAEKELKLMGYRE